MERRRLGRHGHGGHRHGHSSVNALAPV
jgi:hypothetical protein